MINSIKQKREFLGIEDVTTERQKKNGTVIWRLPIKKYGQFIEVGSFESGYVRRMNGCYTPYQLNKCEPHVEFHKEWRWNSQASEQYFTGKYNKYIGKKRILIPKYWDRLEYLIAYCLKNYYINQANEIENGKFIPKWRHEYEMKNGDIDKVRELQSENRRLHNIYLKQTTEIQELQKRFEETAMELDNTKCGWIDDLSITVNGERYKIK